MIQLIVSQIQVFDVHSSMCMYPFCCAFSYVSSGHLDKMIHDYTDCISLTYLHHVFSHICVLRTLGCEHANLYWLHLFGLSNVLLNGHVEKMHSCIVGCVYSMCLFMCSNLCDTTLKLRSCYLNAFFVYLFVIVFLSVCLH